MMGKNSDRKIKVALINPSLAGHSRRGTGIYTTSLFEALKKIENIEVTLIENTRNASFFDLIHYPFFDPFFLTLPLLKSKPTVVTVHDLIPLKFPVQSNPGLRGWIKWQIQKYSLKSVRVILTDSFSSKKDIKEFTGIDEDIIHKISLGVENDFRIIHSEKILSGAKKKLNLPDNFILFVGDVNYNKNVPGLIRSFSKILKLTPSLTLILVGNGFIQKSVELCRIQDLIESLNLLERVIKLGNLAKPDLVCLYNLAKVYVQPSYYEGFGLPVLEAMACGCPVVSSGTSSLSEIARDAAILVEPDDIGGFGNAIELLYKDKGKREYYINQGLNRAQLYKWNTCAQETVSVYKKVLE